MGSIRLMVVDDHPIVRQGLVKLIGMNEEFTVISEASNGVEATRLCAKYKPDIILMDINMPDMDGIEACREITRQNENSKVIALTVCEEIDKITEALAAGAKGYILKNTNLERLTKIIKEVHEGKAYIDPSVTTGLIDRYTRLAQQVREHSPCPLSDREIQVLKLAARGRTNREIAGELFISEKTVKNHVTNILRKLNAADRTEASVIAMEKRYI